MFELRYSDEVEARFQALAKDHGTTFAFHGSSVENFHSIMHNGLLNIFNKARQLPGFFRLCSGFFLPRNGVGFLV